MKPEHEKSEKEILEDGVSQAFSEISRLQNLIETERNKIKAWEKRIELIEASEKDYGICKNCNVTLASIDYNGHGHYVCRGCNSCLEREFEEDYR
jgi:RNA polymerase-binding transcription factor DksA